MNRIWSAGIVALGIVGCSATMNRPAEPIHEPNAAVVEAESLRDAQFRELHQFDNALMTAGDLCPTLCSHHTAICGLATRICAIAKLHEGHARVIDLCEHANETCRETSVRLPKDCFCTGEP